MSTENHTEVSHDSSPKPRTSIWPEVVMKDGWVRIPNRLVWGASLLKLRASDFVVLVYLLSRGFEKESAFPSIETIATQTGLSLSTVVRSIARLRKLYVKVTTSEYGTNEYSFWPLVEALEKLGRIPKRQRRKVRSEKKPVRPKPVALTDKQVLDAVKKAYPKLPDDYREFFTDVDVTDETIWNHAVRVARPTLEAGRALFEPALSFVIQEMMPLVNAGPAA